MKKLNPLESQDSSPNEPPLPRGSNSCRRVGRGACSGSPPRITERAMNPLKRPLFNHVPKFEINPGKNHFRWADSYVLKMMDCGLRGYELYVENGQVIRLSQEEFEAWLIG